MPAHTICVSKRVQLGLNAVPAYLQVQDPDLNEGNPLCVRIHQESVVPVPSLNQFHSQGLDAMLLGRVDLEIRVLGAKRVWWWGLWGLSTRHYQGRVLRRLGRGRQLVRARNEPA